MKRYFDYDEDMEDLGKKMDELQRRKLSKNETDAMFAIRYVPNSFKELESSDEEEDAEENKKTRVERKKQLQQ